MVSRVHEKVFLGIGSEGPRRSRVKRVWGPRRFTALGDKGEVHILLADLVQAGLIEGLAGNRVQRQAEDVDGGAPLRWAASARSNRHLPRRPGNPARWIELHLHVRLTDVLGRHTRVEDVAV